MMNEDSPFNKYFESFIILEKSVLLCKQYKLAENIFNNGFAITFDKERDWTIIRELQYYRKLALEFQKNYSKAIEELEHGLTILEINNKPMSDDQLFIYTDYRNKYQRKLNDIIALKEGNSKQSDSNNLLPELPRTICIDNFTYKYIYTSAKFHEYICKH